MISAQDLPASRVVGSLGQTTRPWRADRFGVAWCRSSLCHAMWLASLLALTVGCRSKPKQDPPAPAKEQASAQSEAPSAPAASSPKPLERARPPIGPDLIVYPGKGVGPVRFGAYPATITRLLGAPCDYQTETRCVHFDRALDLTLEGGVLAKIRVEGPDHVPLGLSAQELGTNAGRTYGTFRGLLEPKIVFGLHKHIVEEEFGKPKSEETLEPKGATGLVARAHYDHLVLEYERIENGNTILTAFELSPDEKSLRLMQKARDDLAKK